MQRRITSMLQHIERTRRSVLEEALAALPALLALGHEPLEDANLLHRARVDLARLDTRLAPAARDGRERVEADELQRARKTSGPARAVGRDRALAEPLTSDSSSGPIGSPAPSFIAVSMSRALASPRSTIRTASSRYGTSSRFTMKLRRHISSDQRCKRHAASVGAQLTLACRCTGRASSSSSRTAPASSPPSRHS